MGGLAQLVEALVDLLGVRLEPWMAPAGLLCCIAIFWPLIRLNLRTGEARRLLRMAARERGDARARLEQQALALVRGRPDGLVVVATEALEQGRRALAAEAIAELRATRELLPQLRRLERALEPPLPAMPSEAALLVERMHAAGLHRKPRGPQALGRRCLQPASQPALEVTQGLAFRHESTARCGQASAAILASSDCASTGLVR